MRKKSPIYGALYDSRAIYRPVRSRDFREQASLVSTPGCDNPHTYSGGVSALFPDRFVLKQAEINPAGSPDGKSINSTAPLTHRAINRSAIAQRRLKPAFLAYFHPAGNAQEKPHLWGAVL